MYAISEKNKTNLIVDFLLSDLEAVNFNPRKELIIKNLEKLRQTEIFAPVIIGKFNDKFYLIDGYHRKTVIEERGITSIDAIIFEYNNEWEMKTDAYAFNINHGERLTDDEIGNGIFNKYNYYLENSISVTFEQLGAEFSMNSRMANSYVRWGKVKNALNEDISKSIADILARFEDNEEGKTKMIDFFNTHRRLKVHEMRKAYDCYIAGKDYYKEALALQQNLDIINMNEKLPEKKPIQNEKIEPFANGNQNIVDGEKNIEEINKSLGSTPTVLEVKNILKTLFKNIKQTYVQMEAMKENGQLKFYAEYKKDIKAMESLISDIESFADEGWIDQNTDTDKE